MGEESTAAMPWLPKAPGPVLYCPMEHSPDIGPGIFLPRAPAVAAGARGAVWLSADGEVEAIALAEAARRVGEGVLPMVCHGPAAARRLDTAPFAAFDVLELYAFAHPARFCLPTVRGLAEALGLPLPGTLEEEAVTLYAAAHALLAGLADAVHPADAAALPIAQAMAHGGWSWGTAVVAALAAGTGKDTGAAADAAAAPPSKPFDGLKVWQRIEEWEEQAPDAAPGNLAVEGEEARARLAAVLGAGAEKRPGQADYAAGVSAAFAPRERSGEPRFVLAEAGTGVGKTLGYLAPASIWAEKNQGPVWISTYTRNLQRQLDGELDRVFPDPARKEEKVVVRKGRENYLCLLNMEEAVARLPTATGENAVALGLMGRWALASRDGDMVGGDFPAWLSHLVGRRLTLDLTDTRGECIYSACAHYRKCFIENSIRRARKADIVIANHALVMIQAALGGAEDGRLPTRYVFDEGHHLFGAADSAFSAHFSGVEAAELRRWFLGAEQQRRSRARGLKGRVEDLVGGDGRGADALAGALNAARALPAAGWNQRIAGGAPTGPAEAFLALVRQQVYARDAESSTSYGLETDTEPPVPELLEAADALEEALGELGRPVAVLVQALAAMLDTEAGELDSEKRLRIEAVCRSLQRRAVAPLDAWRAMLRDLREETPAEFVDWFGVERFDGRDMDTGFHRHWVDPTRPFAEVVAEPAHGVLITSASLCDATGDAEADWAVAEARTGAAYLAAPALHVAAPSPFDYEARTRVLVVTDVNRNNADQIAAAYRELFLAGGGGGLGLFTAITRLRAVHQRIAGPLDEAGLTLLAQHIDGMDTGTLIDIFRAEEDWCLLGTDAVRDGVDVPGRSLRLIVFDRVPWPRPDILHRARRQAFGGRAYDEMLTRLKLKQAFGRLVRRAEDYGVFVMLDRALPSRLAGAFPEGVEVKRLGLAEVVAETRAFLGERA